MQKDCCAARIKAEVYGLYWRRETKEIHTGYCLGIILGVDWYGSAWRTIRGNEAKCKKIWGLSF